MLCLLLCAYYFCVVFILFFAFDVSSILKHFAFLAWKVNKSILSSLSLTFIRLLKTAWFIYRNLVQLTWLKFTLPQRCEEETHHHNNCNKAGNLLKCFKHGKKMKLFSALRHFRNTRLWLSWQRWNVQQQSKAFR